MGARPSPFKKGGGFLNNVDVTIVGYQFTDKFNGEDFVPGKNPKTGKEKFHSLNFVPELLVDGAEKAETTTLFAGGFDAFDISDDGHTLTPTVDGYELGSGTAFAKFIESLVTAGQKAGTFSENELPEDEINYEAIIGLRVRVTQEVDAEATAKFGQRPSKKGDKKFNRTTLVVTQVYGRAEGAAKTATAAATKSTKGGKAATTGIPAESLTALKAILTKAGGSLPVAKIALKVATQVKGPNKDAIREYLSDTDNLGNLAGIAFDAEEGVVALA